MKHPDRIAQLFKDSTVLITGVTGFVGKILLSKILRSCGGVRKVYALVRNQEDKEAHLRLKEIFKSPLFEGPSNKVEAVCGDLLGSFDSVDLEKIREDVQIIYHCADLKLGGLKDVVLTNVRGTKQMLDLARSCKKLKAFIHVSTAFCHLKEILPEAVVDVSVNPHEVIQICEYFEWNVVERVKKDILGPFSDCYHFTKALSENLVAQEMGELPVVIVRPSVVLPTLKEPVPGYSETTPSGLLIGVGKGLIRTLHCKEDARLNCIPADILANFCLFSTFDYVTNKDRRVYNAVAGQEYKVKEIVEVGRDVLKTLPYRNVFWYPGFSLTESKIKHYVIFGWLQLLPALLLDAVLILCRIKPLFLDVQSNAWNIYALCEFYTNRSWSFDRSKSLEAIKTLNAKETEIYKFVGIGDLKEYFANCVQGTQEYTLKETGGTKEAHLQLKLMWYVDKICRILMIAGFFYCVYVTVGNLL